MRVQLVAVALLAAAACASTPPPAPMPMPPGPAAPPPAPPPTVTERVMQPPPPAATAASLYADSCHKDLAAAEAQVAVVFAVTGARTVDNTLEPFNEASRYLDNAGERANLMKEVHPDAAVRDAARACAQDTDKLASKLSLDHKLFEAIKAVDVSAADSDTKRMKELTLRDYHLAGVDLDDAKRARVQKLDEDMTVLGQDFEKNVAEDTRSIEVTDPKRLAGLPADWIASHPPDAKGVIHITTDYPDYVPFITYADDDALRHELGVKYWSRGDAHNEEILQKLLVLRREKANLLGFADWADYASADKMLRGGKAEAEFIERVTKLVSARAKRDYAELLAQLKKHDPKATAVTDWQKSYLENQIKKEKYAVDSNEVRQYFGYEQTLKGLLDITSEMYDIQYQPVANAETWHPDVQVFDVMRGGTKLGRIFLDMHPRPDKYKHFAQFGIEAGISGKQLPEGALVCNLPDPKKTDGKPALMDHGDAVTMFHEFGHLMHYILGGQHHWVRIAGTNVEQDFVEAPSQMFEEWGWRYETLKRFAKHAETGKVIPEELVNKMRRAEKFGLGTQTAQQMYYAALSLELHRADPAKLDQMKLVKELKAKYTPFAYVEGTKFHTSFGHLIGYSSMYYTYMWSLVIAKDMLTAFDKKGLMDPTADHRYRDDVLAPGGSKDAADLVKDFLGRPYDFKAFERYMSN
jgi:thimet oligopeptidase